MAGRKRKRSWKESSSQPEGSGDSSSSTPLTVSGGRQSIKAVRRKGRKQLLIKPAEPLPPALLSSNVLSSLHTVPGPVSDENNYFLWPIVHPYLFFKSKVYYQILQSREGDKEERSSSVGVVWGGITPVGVECGGVSLVGVLRCELGHDLNLSGIFLDGKESVQLSLVMCGVEKRWLLKLEVGVDISSYLMIKMDPRLANLSYNEMFLMSTHFKVFLSHDKEDSSYVRSLRLELWATDKVTNISDPSAPCRRSGGLRRHSEESIHKMVEMLYPEYCKEEDDFTHGSEQGPIVGNSSIVTQIQQFYRHIQLRKKPSVSPHLHTPGLLAKLRDYQCGAVAWMLGRENGEGEEDAALHVLWRELPLKGDGGGQVYFNPYTASFSPVFFPKKSTFSKGGILADEMGLGKTVEILALILAGRWPGTGPVGGDENGPASAGGDGNGPGGAGVDGNGPAGVDGNGPAGGDGDGNGPAGAGGDGKGPANGGGTGNEPDPNSAERVSCLCGAFEARPEDRLVQCERCLQWQHTTCSGYEGEEHFICTRCLLREPYPCKTTLIVCPQTIFKQWKEEIEKHTDQGVLKVMMYPGVAKKYVSPLALGSCDIVLATYEMLKSELYHVTSQDYYKKFRHPKRFGCLPSPLPAVYWWRICLDEAQMVESTTARAAEMMLKLSAVNRWCVTGTPVQKDLRDLYGLLLFLGVDPYCIQQWYCKLLWSPFLEGNDVPMTSLFSNLMWRNSKEDVAEELQLPDQMERIHWVVFSSVEEYFYRRQQESCISRISALSRNADMALSSMQQSTLREFLTPLHSLRQACCTPQIVKTGYLPQDLSKIPVTMEVLLGKLTQQAKVEAREALRQLISTLNGLAGLYILRKDLSAAVSCYRGVISFWTEYKEQDVECDKLQRIHTLENLAALLKEETVSMEAGYTLRDDDLMREAEELRSEYSKRADDSVRVAMSVLESHKNAVNLTLKKSRDKKDIEMESLHCPPMDSSPSFSQEKCLDSPTTLIISPLTTQSRENISPPKEEFSPKGKSPDPPREMSTPPREDHTPLWWHVLGNWCLEKSREEDLLDSIHMEMSSNPDRSLSNPTKLSFDDIGGAGLFLNLKLSSIEDTRQEALHSMLALSATPTLEQVKRAVDCHMITQPALLQRELCDCCLAERTSVKYEGELFSKFNSQAEHGRFPSLFERIVKCMISFSRRNRAPEAIVNAGQCCLDYIESLRKEYSAIRSLWMSLEHRLGIQHELQQASTKLRLVTVYDYLPCPQAVHESDIPFQVASMELGKEEHLSKLKKCVGQVMYLKSLEKFQHQKEPNRESCPICTTEMGKEWGVFPCGHSLCLECTNTLIKRRRGYSVVVGVTKLSCPLCRDPCLSSEINFVKLGLDHDDKSSEEEGEEVVTVKGDHASKILAIVETLLRIQRNDPGAKSLVFSSWLDVLGHISESLQGNHIPHHLHKNKLSFQALLTSFKTSPDINVLLLPFQSGSKGLNIVEATHVLLVEPLLNVGEELQAIGRVHRMGQTRPVTVHRFIVRRTVEERMHELLHVNRHHSHALLKDSTSNLTCGEVTNLMMGGASEL